LSVGDHILSVQLNGHEALLTMAEDLEADVKRADVLDSRRGIRVVASSIRLYSHRGCVLPRKELVVLAGMVGWNLYS
jgi:hypothetical protein